MFLALREMRRAAVRFGLLVMAVGLLVFLILAQQALQDGLLTAFVGGIRNQSAPVLVYSVDGQKALQGSIIPPPLEEAVRGTEGVGAAARLGQSTFTVTDDGDDGDAAIVGAEDPALGTPTTLSSGRRPEAQGEAVGSEADYRLGEQVVVEAAGPGVEPVTVTVVGLGRDLQLNVSPTLFTDYPTFEAAVRATNPDATEVLPSAIAVQPADGVEAEALIARLDAASPEAQALTRTQAADESPGVAQVRQSFQIVFLPLWGSLDTWREVTGANRPGEAVGDDIVQALVVRTDGPADAVGAAIVAATDDATDALTIEAAIDSLPGVTEQRSTFNQIIGVTAVIALVVVALFFALITVERTALYGILKAIGASGPTLFVGVVTQAVVVTLVACGIGAAAALGLDALVPPGSIPFAASAGRILSSVVLLLVAAVVGCTFSLRRVLRVDPASAIG